MLDTDTVSYALRDHGRVRARIIEHRPSDLCISAITVAELRFGAHRRASPKIQGLIDVFTSDIEVLPFDELCAGHFGRLGADLAARGTPIGDFDVLIAAHALAAGATLVTNNIRHFGRIEGLSVESWL
jgi:tRNA(fMet)-specific endonuclease VapC